MIKVCLIGADVEKEKSLLESQSGIFLKRIPIASLDEMLDDIAIHTPDILVISDVCGKIDADSLCLHTYMLNPAIRTLIITKEDADYQRLENTGFSSKGFMLHEQRHAIVRAVRVMHDGEAWLSRKLVTAVMDHLASSSLTANRKPRLINNK
jgi:DNA-binding NarL/FixJ family response regulator